MAVLKRFLAVALIFSVSFMSFLSSADATLVESALFVESVSKQGIDLQTLQKLLESNIVKEKLKALGLTEEEIIQRLQALDEEQLHVLATEMQNGIRTGGDSALSFVISLLVIAILVVVLLQLTGHRIIVVED